MQTPPDPCLSRSAPVSHDRLEVWKDFETDREHSRGWVLPSSKETRFLVACASRNDNAMGVRNEVWLPNERQWTGNAGVLGIYARPFLTATVLPATSQGRFGRSTGALSRSSMRS